MRAAAATLFLAQGGVSPECQKVADAECAECYALIGSRPCDGPMVARQSGPGAAEWRCYSPSTLANESYHSGSCYCSRDAELRKVFSDCDQGVTTTTVFEQNQAGSKCYRIPTIIPTQDGALLAFAEQRLDGCGDGGSHNLVLRRSEDGGLTWGEIVVAVKGDGVALSNPNPVEVALAGGKRAVLLHYDTQNNPSTAHHGKNMQVWSYDGGKTWSDTKDISADMPSGFVGCMPGPSAGVQGPDGTIYFTCHGFGTQAFLYWSQDLGATWHASAPLPGLDECSVAQLANTSLLMNCRTGAGHRAQVIWGADGTPRTGVVPHPELKDPNCQGSVVRDGATVVLTNNNATTRTHLVTRVSADGGATWADGRVVTAGPSAYSQGVAWTGRFGVLYETGTVSAYERIDFSSWASGQVLV